MDRICIAGIDIGCRFQFEQTRSAFCHFIKGQYRDNNALHTGIYEQGQYLEQFPENAWDAYAEYKCFSCLISDVLMKHDRLLVHSVAVVIKGDAYLFAAPSGTGKTTLYRNLSKLYGHEIEIISGDCAALHVVSGNNIHVYPTPWNGKEGWRSMRDAPLRGIFFLVQANYDNLRQIIAMDAVVPMFQQIETYTKTEETIHQLARMEEQILSSVSLWRFENTGSIESARLLYECLKDNTKPRI